MVRHSLQRILYFLLLTISVMAHAGIEVRPDVKSFEFTGQSEETLELLSETVNHYTVEETYTDTCTRAIPYTENVCRDVTEYRDVNCRMTPSEEVCENVPRQDCHTEYETECRNESDTVCTNEPRQVCGYKSEPVCRSVTRYREECNTTRGEPICEEVNGRRICRPGEPRRECHQVSYQDEECHNESRYVCETENERSCRDVTRRVCEQVPRRDCRTVYERECRTIPGERECDREPYTRQVCEDETRYRYEEYTCTKTRDVPKSDVVKRDEMKVIVAMETSEEVTAVGTVSVMLKGSEVSVKAESDENIFMLISNERDPKEQLVRVKLKVFKMSDVVKPLRAEISELHYDDGAISFVMGKVALAGSVKININLSTVFKKNFFDHSFNQEEFEVTPIDDNRVRVKFHLKKMMGNNRPKLFKYKVKISVHPALPGSFINNDQSVLTPKVHSQKL